MMANSLEWYYSLWLKLSNYSSDIPFSHNKKAQLGVSLHVQYYYTLFLRHLIAFIDCESEASFKAPLLLKKAEGVEPSLGSVSYLDTSSQSISFTHHALP